MNCTETIRTIIEALLSFNSKDDSSLDYEISDKLYNILNELNESEQPVVLIDASIKTDNEMDKIYDDIFPLTIVKDRYMGVYSGGLFTAWHMYSEYVPEEIGDDDCTAFDFWNNDSKEYIIGIGKTPDDAVRDLYLKLKRRNKQ